MLNYSVAEIRENMRKTRFLATCAIIMGCSITCWAQRPYSFDAKDYVSTDDKRAPQSAFSYDENYHQGQRQQQHSLQNGQGKS